MWHLATNVPCVAWILVILVVCVACGCGESAEDTSNEDLVLAQKFALERHQEQVHFALQRAILTGWKDDVELDPINGKARDELYDFFATGPWKVVAAKACTWIKEKTELPTNEQLRTWYLDAYPQYHEEFYGRTLDYELPDTTQFRLGVFDRARPVLARHRVLTDVSQFAKEFEPVAGGFRELRARLTREQTLPDATERELRSYVFDRMTQSGNFTAEPAPRK